MYNCLVNKLLIARAFQWEFDLQNLNPMRRVIACALMFEVWQTNQNHSQLETKNNFP